MILTPLQFAFGEELFLFRAVQGSLVTWDVAILLYSLRALRAHMNLTS